MKRPHRNRLFLIVFTTILLATLIILSSLPGSLLQFITTPVSIVLRPVEQFFSRGIDNISGFFGSLSDSERIRRENRDLHLENARLRSEIRQLAEAGRQYAQLKDAFQLKDLFAQYEIVGARVLTRDIGLWFDVFRIDLGSRDGFAVSETTSYAVIDAESNLVGRVIATDLISGKVLPLLHEGFSVSACVDQPNGALMRVRGTLELKEQGLCLADQITADASVNPGDIIVTSGLGGLFPAGIPIGEVETVIDSDTRIQRQAVIRPYTDIGQISTVFVMRGIEP